jgi:CBS domain-containing protein
MEDTMTTVRHILQEKGAVVWTIPPDASVRDAITMMDKNDIGLLVISNAGELVGIVSERDIARKVILKEKSPGTTPVRDIMTTDVVTIAPEQSIDECMTLMTSKHIRHLPVMDGRKLAGVVSIGDVVKATIVEKEHLIYELQNYISGGR